ncbi:hypothetical protein DUZ99_02950 [Xylanibacillus composti]|uniref:Siderophore biosynthesis protein IucA n=1 Tax=Xylanibacillus composti TaxID=1572762 RepID=A0A8J4M1H0_9BACL|nr:IucA/IucC family protein [Xylanibacillus composti]MDT9723956.1 hypothetical protein [Xylanibacillus composti]GIQ67837.1 siderophore biosynthesis protein IucA [Xylanibacillus composti]
MTAFMQELFALTTSPIAREVRRRVSRQLVEALLHERIVQAEEATAAEEAMFAAAWAAVSLPQAASAGSGALANTGDFCAGTEGVAACRDAIGAGVSGFQREAGANRTWKLIGRNEQNERVVYACRGRWMLGFGRFRLTADPLLRAHDGLFEEVSSISGLVRELLTHLPGTDAHKLAAFTHELEQTWLHDAFLRLQRARGTETRLAADQLAYDELEGELAHGHPYHPSYKSRIGFTLEDQVRYAPDLLPTFSLLWVGVHRDWVHVGHSAGLRYERLLEKELGGELARLKEKIPAAEREKYVLMPVHPWQWREVIAKHYFPYMQAGIVIPLGEGQDRYRPQASIRTLSNVTDSGKCQVKTSLSIMNTSAKRIIQPYHAKDAPAISDWLHELLQADAFLKETCGLILLREQAGVSFRYDRLPAPLAERLHGSLGALWRESLAAHAGEGEQALPYTAVSERREDVPYLVSWHRQYGVERWFRQLLRVTLHPLLHLLYAYGVGVEAHAQNMVLIHRGGWPVRAALRDLPGGIRCLSACPAYPALPELTDSSYLSTEVAEHVRDYWADAILHIHLYEWALLLHEHYGLDEGVFWMWTAETIQDYQEQFPEHEAAYVRFDLFAEQVEVGELAARKVYGEDGERDQYASNPLHAAKMALAVKEVRA